MMWMGQNRQPNEAGKHAMNRLAEFHLASDLDEPLFHLLKRVVQLAADLHAARGGRKGLTERQFTVLSSLSENEGTSQADLVRRTGIDRSTLADLARRLEKKGLLTRRRCRHDRRAYQLFLTAQGRKALGSMAPLMAEVDALLLSALPRDQALVFRESLRLLASEDTARRLIRKARDNAEAKARPQNGKTHLPSVEMQTTALFRPRNALRHKPSLQRVKLDGSTAR